MVVTASQHKTLGSPYYLFSFQHITSKERVSFLPELSINNSRFDLFRFAEGNTSNPDQLPQANFVYEGQYYYSIYEQVSSGNTNPSLSHNKLESGRAVVIIDNDNPDNCFFESYTSSNEEFENIIFVSSNEENCLTTTTTEAPIELTNPIITDKDEYIIVGNNEYLQYV